MSVKHTSTEIIEKAGIKKTQSRIAMVDVLLRSKKPISASEIFTILKKDGADKVTVYRTLDALEDKGIVRRVATGERETKYELIHQSDDHHHVICIKCKKVSDFTGCDAENLIKKALKQVGGFESVSHHTFDIFGICNPCGRK